MDIGKVLAQLHEELANLDAAIVCLERLQQQAARRRGRPPVLPSDARVPAKTARPANVRVRKPAPQAVE